LWNSLIYGPEALGCNLMATPLGHSLAGYAIYTVADGAPGQRSKSLALLCVCMANAADLDFLPGTLLGSPALYHQGVTHSLGFALLASLGVAGVCRPRGKPFATVVFWSGMAYVSHLVIDLLGPDARPPHGIPLLWPISGEHFISPWALFLGVRHAASGTASTLEWLEGIAHLYNLAAMALEVGLLLPCVLLGQRHRSKPRQATEPAGA
jgi:inner membrane protein